MLDACHFVPNNRSNAKLFIQFAAQGIAWLLAFLNFSAGKFPLQRHGLMPGALANQDSFIFPDKRGNNSFHVSSPDSLRPS